MFFNPIRLRTDYSSECGAVIASKNPIFSWGVMHSEKNSVQIKCRVKVYDGNTTLWDSTELKTSENSISYGGEPLPSGRKIKWSVTLWDNFYNVSTTASQSFVTPLYTKWCADWISVANYEKGRVYRFSNEFYLDEKAQNAALFVSAAGWCNVRINGTELTDMLLAPAFTDYTKRRLYMTHIITLLLKKGKNKIEIDVSDGWRGNVGDYLKIISRKVAFFGKTSVSAVILTQNSKGEQNQICTDKSWKCETTEIVYSNIFDGEKHDYTAMPQAVKVCCEKKASFVTAPQTLAPVREKRRITPLCIDYINNKYIVDFGINLAGFVEIVPPEKHHDKTKITVRHAETTDENGELFTDTLRTAAATDEYISGGKCTVLKPKFSYHGFRYAEIDGFPGLLTAEHICAVQIYTDIETDNRFTCGSPIVNAIESCIVQTEKSNIHGIATDCPQRDERMGWLNDATVRFEAMPYYFEACRLFSKIADDITDEQGQNGEIGSVAPLIYGSYPADPVCSSFLIAVYMNWLHFGDSETLEKNYSAMVRWNSYLASRTENGIVNYGVYGDWAGPEKYCIAPENPHSAVTPEIFMSTGYHYYNYVLLEKMAHILKKDSDAKSFSEKTEMIKSAFLNKWVNKENGSVGTCSQGCLAFALWLNILPAETAEKTAALLNQKVVEAGFALTTGNLTSRYIYDALTEFGYINTAWRLIERREYPSLGFMLENGATTVWERFELKKTNNMNSHNHPMYGAVSYWLYKYIAGISPLECGWKKIRVKPFMPEKLNCAEAAVSTPYGLVKVKWERCFGQINLLLTVPFNCECEVILGTKNEWVGSGVHTFHYNSMA